MLAKREPDVHDGASYSDAPDERSSRHSSPRRDSAPSKSHRAHCQPDENYCLLVTIQLQQSSDDTSAGVSVPAGALTDKIIRLYLSQVIADITQVVILNNTDFVVYRGRRSKDEGMPYDEAAHYIRNIVGSRDWVGFPVVVRATPLTLAESKARIADAREFVRSLTMSKAQLDHQEAQRADDERQRAERALALRMEFNRRLQTHSRLDKGTSRPRSVYVTPDSSPNRHRPSDDDRRGRDALLSARSSERSVRSHSSSESDPQTDTGDDSDASRRMTTSNRERRRLKSRRRDRRRGGRGGREKSNRGKMSLPIFRDSTKDDAISYNDWRCEVDALILRGHPEKKIKLAVLDALEGRPKRAAQVADTDHKGRVGKGKLQKVLAVLEDAYGRSVTYQSLIRELCSIRQKRGETPKAYYERLTTIVLLIRERHGDRIKVKELDSTAKDCFYSGLHEQYQPLVVHLKDKAYTTASDLLKAIRVHEETESNLRDHGYYYRPRYDNSHKPTTDKFVKKSEGYAAKVTQLPDEEPRSQSEPSDTSDVDEGFEVGYYQGVIQAADMNDDVGRCYNCNNPGHKWRDCTKPLREGLKRAYERLQQLQLNYKGDMKKKGVHVPRSGAMAPAPVAVKA